MKLLLLAGGRGMKKAPPLLDRRDEGVLRGTTRLRADTCPLSLCPITGAGRRGLAAAPGWVWSLMRLPRAFHRRALAYGTASSGPFVADERIIQHLPRFGKRNFAVEIGGVKGAPMTQAARTCDGRQPRSTACCAMAQRMVALFLCFSTFGRFRWSGGSWYTGSSKGGMPYDDRYPRRAHC